MHEWHSGSEVFRLISNNPEVKTLLVRAFCSLHLKGSERHAGDNASTNYQLAPDNRSKRRRSHHAAEGRHKRFSKTAPWRVLSEIPSSFPACNATAIPASLASARTVSVVQQKQAPLCKTCRALCPERHHFAKASSTHIHISTHLHNQLSVVTHASAPVKDHTDLRLQQTGAHKGDVWQEDGFGRR